MKVAIVLACMMALAAAVDDVAVADQTAAEQYRSYGHGISRSYGGHGYGYGGYSRGGYGGHYGGRGYSGYGHSRRGRSVEDEVEVDTTPEEYSSQRWGGRSYYGGYGNGYNRYNNYNGYNSYNRYNNYGSYPSHYNRNYYGGWY